MPEQSESESPDLRKGVPLDSVPDGGLLAGHVGDAKVLITRDGQDVRAFSAECTHLGAPLGDGLVIDGQVRCPWHHACFDLRTGRAVASPAFDALTAWTVERRGPMVFVTRKMNGKDPALAMPGGTPRFVIVGSGAAGYAAAFELRRQGFQGSLTMLAAEVEAPYDRTLLTKDYLDGRFDDDRLRIARTSLYDLHVHALYGVKAERLDRDERQVILSTGQTVSYDKLLLATGSEPKRLDVPGADLPHVHVLRSLADCRALLAKLDSSARVVVIGGSFIGLEAAASIRSRGNDVTVVTPESEPMARVLGPQLSQAIVAVHRHKGVTLHLAVDVVRIETHAVVLADGSTVAADIVIVGIGVTPRVELAKAAGLMVDNGVVVDSTLATNDQNIFAAGDIARWPDPHSGAVIRVEHWVVAQRQAQTAARNMMGAAEVYADVPFFWSKHFDFSLRYVGHADTWDSIVIEGDLASGKAVVCYRKDGRDAAVATVGEDRRALEIARDMERDVSGF